MHLDVRVLASPLALSRIGIVVPRHQHSAVDRNKLKRRLRELARTELLPITRGLAAIDIAIRARREGYAASMDLLRADIDAIRARVTRGTEST